MKRHERHALLQRLRDKGNITGPEFEDLLGCIGHDDDQPGKPGDGEPGGPIGTSGSGPTGPPDPP